MGCGMVRKIDELGRVVLPKEMRRILNIHTGSSVEMNINSDNKIVISKFSELENMINFLDVLGQIIYDELNLKCIICDDEKVLNVFGESKKIFLHKKLNNIDESFDYCKSKNIITANLKDIIASSEEQMANIFFIDYQNVILGCVIVLKENLTENEKEKINILINYFLKLID